MSTSSEATEGVRLLDCDDDRQWDDFIRSSPEGNAFSLSGFLAAQAGDYVRHLCMLGSEIVGSALIVKPNDVTFQAPHPYTLYQGVALAPFKETGSSGTTKRLSITSKIADALSRRYPFHSLCMHPRLTDLRGFQWCNYDAPHRGRYEFTLFYTGIISLEKHAKFDDFVHSLSSGRKGDLKRARQRGVLVTPSDDVDGFLKLYQKTFSRQGIELPRLAIEMVERIVTTVLKSGLGELKFAIVEGALASAAVALTDDRCGYYLFGASDPEYRDTGAGAAAVVACIEDSYVTGRPKFDMVGINSPARGFFKTSFGAQPEAYYSLTFRSP